MCYVLLLNMRTTCLVSLLTTVLVSSSTFGQAPPTSPSPSPSPAPAAGGGPTLSIESQAIAYEAINQIAIGIGDRARLHLPPNVSILLGTPANMAAIGAFYAFRASADQMANAYNNGPTKSAIDQAKNPFFMGTYLDAAGGIASLLTAMKAQTTVTGGTFSPVDQALYSDLEKHLAQPLVTTAYPGDLASANKIVSSLVDRVYVERTKYVGTKPADDALKALDTQLNTFQTALTNPSGQQMGAVTLGAAILKRLGQIDDRGENVDNANYAVLTVSDDVAGGGMRSNLYFLLNLFVPAPHPSYNGGAVVSYSLRDQSGKYISADTLRFVFGYTKWRAPAMREKGGKGWSNYKSKFKKGHWIPVY